MKTINLDLQYIILSGDKESGLSMAGCTAHVIRACIKAVYPQAMTRTDSEIWAEIMELLEVAANTSGSTIELDETCFHWLYEVIDKAELQPMMSGYLRTLRRYLSEVKKNASS